MLRYCSGRYRVGLGKMTKASVGHFVIPSKMPTGNFLNKARIITDGANFVNSGDEDNKTKRQEVTVG